jgi:hypothetical protein
MYAWARPSRSFAVSMAIGFVTAGCASNPCRTRYFYSMNEGAVRMPPSQQCEKQKAQGTSSVQPIARR